MCRRLGGTAGELVAPAVSSLEVNDEQICAYCTQVFHTQMFCNALMVFV